MIIIFASTWERACCVCVCVCSFSSSARDQIDDGAHSEVGARNVCANDVDWRETVTTTVTATATATHKYKLAHSQEIVKCITNFIIYLLTTRKSTTNEKENNAHAKHTHTDTQKKCERMHSRIHTRTNVRRTYSSPLQKYISLNVLKAIWCTGNGTTTSYIYNYMSQGGANRERHVCIPRSRRIDRWKVPVGFLQMKFILVRERRWGGQGSSDSNSLSLSVLSPLHIFGIISHKW